MAEVAHMASQHRISHGHGSLRVGIFLPPEPEDHPLE